MSTIDTTPTTAEKNPLALAISQTLKNSSPAKAETQLALIGDEHGDEQLKLIVGELPPADLTALLTEGDFTKPSLASSFISPEQFMEAFNRLAARWGDVNRRSPVEAHQQEVADLILSVILPASADRKTLLLDALLGDTLGEDAVVAISLMQKDNMEFLANENVGAFERGTYQELYAEISERDHALFLRIRGEILALHRDHAEDPGKEEAKAYNFLKKTMSAMSRRAQEFVSAPAADGEEEVFGGV